MPNSDAERPRVSTEEARRHLSAVLESESLRSSRRAKDFLRFIVEATLDGHTEILKERTIGELVFGRPDYNPATDTLVRVGANELRRRLAQYYASAGDVPFRIELPTGTYVPQFHVQEPPGGAAPSPGPTPPVTQRYRRFILPALSTLAVLSIGVALVVRYRPSPTPLDLFWGPVLAKSDPLLISDPSRGTKRFVLVPRSANELQRRLHEGAPLIAFRPDEIVETDEVLTTGSAHAIVTVSSFLSLHGRQPLLRIATELVPGDTKDRPLVFFGAFSNPWTLETNRNLRFAFQVITDEKGWKMAIVDRDKPGRRWVAETSNHFYDATIDYGIVTRVIDSAGRPIISLGGVTHLGTRAAADLVTSSDLWARLARNGPKDWYDKNIQVVFETRIVGRTPGPPQVIDTHFW